MLQAFSTIQRATTAARVRLGDQSIGTQVSGGRVQVVRVTYRRNGTSEVAPVSDFLPLDKAAAFLDAMQ